MKKKPLILAVCGVKNSGKTILIQKLIPLLQNQGLKVAAVKHDGHDFEPDVPGTDSHSFWKAGAVGTAIFSDSKYMVNPEKENVLRADRRAVSRGGFDSCRGTQKHSLSQA